MIFCRWARNCGPAPLSSPCAAKSRKMECPVFFAAFAEGVFDVEDLKFRTDELAQFIQAASGRYNFSTEKLIAVGYSNGANIAASLILLHPHYFAAAVFFRVMVPFTPEIIRDFRNLPFSSAPVIGIQLFPEASRKNSPKCSRTAVPT